MPLSYSWENRLFYLEAKRKWLPRRSPIWSHLATFSFRTATAATKLTVTCSWTWHALTWHCVSLGWHLHICAFGGERGMGRGCYLWFGSANYLLKKLLPIRNRIRMSPCAHISEHPPRSHQTRTIGAASRLIELPPGEEIDMMNLDSTMRAFLKVKRRQASTRPVQGTTAAAHHLYHCTLHNAHCPRLTECSRLCSTR